MTAKVIAKRIGYFFIFCFIVWMVSHLCTIYSKEIVTEEYYQNGIPTILPLLNSEIFMSFVFVVTMGVYLIIAAILWHYHEIPLHRVEKANPMLMKVVFGLGLCGLLINKTFWVIAIVLAFMPWQWIGDHISHVIYRGVSGYLPDLSAHKAEKIPSTKDHKQKKQDKPSEGA